jgi:hypothetical protein
VPEFLKLPRLLVLADNEADARRLRALLGVKLDGEARALLLVKLNRAQRTSLPTITVRDGPALATTTNQDYRARSSPRMPWPGLVTCIWTAPLM